MTSIECLYIALLGGAGVAAAWITCIRFKAERVRLLAEAQWPVACAAKLAGAAGLAGGGLRQGFRLALLITIVPMLLVLCVKRPRLRCRWRIEAPPSAVARTAVAPGLH